jgi:hypothetical protein
MGGLIMDFGKVEECSVAALRSGVIITNAGAHTHTHAGAHTHTHAGAHTHTHANDVNIVD